MPNYNHNNRHNNNRHNGADIYTIVTERLLKKIESGDYRKWRDLVPHSYNAARNYDSGRVYGFLNQMLLNGAPIPEFVTYKKIKEYQQENPAIKLKEDATRYFVVENFVYNVARQGDALDAALAEGDEDDATDTKFCHRYYNVYSVADVEGLEPKWWRPYDPSADTNPMDSVPETGRFIAQYLRNSGVNLTRGGSMDSYSPATDTINIRNGDEFTSPRAMYATCFHEMAHSTGAAHRLHRSFGHHFGSETYSKEELVAEFCAAFLTAELLPTVTEDIEEEASAAYIAGWSEKLRSNPKWALTASTQAEKAAKFIHNIADDAVITI